MRQICLALAVLKPHVSMMGAMVAGETEMGNRLSREEARLRRDEIRLKREEARRKRDEARAERRRHKRRNRPNSGRGFDIHLTAWASTSFFLFVINLLTGITTPWFLYPTLGWFIGVAIHAAAVGRIGPMIRKAFSTIRGRGWYDPFGDEPPSNKYGKQPLNSSRLEEESSIVQQDSAMVEEESKTALPR